MMVYKNKIFFIFLLTILSYFSVYSKIEIENISLDSWSEKKETINDENIKNIFSKEIENSVELLTKDDNSWPLLDKNQKEEFKNKIENLKNEEIIIGYSQKIIPKIIYTQKSGLMVWHKESFVNIDKDVHVHIVHADNPSEMHFVDGNILIKSNDEIKSETTNNYRNASNEIIDKTQYEYLNSPSVHVGTSADMSATRCEALFQLLSTLAGMLDSKVPTSPGAATGAVSAAQAAICSQIVKIAP